MKSSVQASIGDRSRLVRRSLLFALLAAIVDHGLKKAFNICLGLPWAWRQGAPDQLPEAAPADAAGD